MTTGLNLASKQVPLDFLEIEDNSVDATPKLRKMASKDR